jgi:heptosyltransferase-2
MVQSLKKIIPDCTIDYMCIPATANVLQNNPHIRNIIIYDKKSGNKLTKLKRIISTVRSEKYDMVICPHRSFRSALITYYSRAKIRIGFNKNSLSFLLTQKAVYNKNEHEIKRNLSLINNIPGIKPQNSDLILKPELFPTSDDKDIVNSLLKSAQPQPVNKLLSFAPCSKWFTKKIPENKSAEIINSLISSDYSVAIIGGKDDEDYCNSVMNQIKNKSKLINFAGKLTPVQSSFVIQKSSILITVDSAAAHLGASTDTPVVMIYGSTVPAFGFYPLTSKNIIIENNSLDCRPCTNHGRASCPKKHFKCMKEINIEQTKNSIELLIKHN